VGGNLKPKIKGFDCGFPYELSAYELREKTHLIKGNLEHANAFGAHLAQLLRNIAKSREAALAPVEPEDV
jgi:hypothetical protein